jgi:hypothetical protein
MPGPDEITPQKKAAFRLRSCSFVGAPVFCHYSLYSEEDQQFHSKPWLRVFHQMCQIVGWREHRDSFSNFLRKMSKIAGHEPCAGRVRQCKERHVFQVGPSMRPANGIGKVHALFNQELQPKRRKPKPVKLGTSCDGPVFFDDQRAAEIEGQHTYCSNSGG